MTEEPEKPRLMICEARYTCEKAQVNMHCNPHDHRDTCSMQCSVHGVGEKIRCREITDEELVYFRMLYPEVKR